MRVWPVGVDEGGIVGERRAWRGEEEGWEGALLDGNVPAGVDWHVAGTKRRSYEKLLRRDTMVDVLGVRDGRGLCTRLEEREGEKRKKEK